MRFLPAALIALLISSLPAGAAAPLNVWQLTAAATVGNVVAEIDLAGAYFDGQGVTPDRVAAYSWMLRAAQAGSPDAQTQLAEMLLSGYGHPPDGGEAIAWLVTATDQDYGPAEARLGDVYFYGLAGHTDWTRAIAPYRAASGKRIASAEVNLAEIDQCTCGPGNHSEALRLLHDAADQNYAPAFTRLGETYQDGTLGVPHDNAAGVAWFQKAAAQNEPEALYRIGLSYENGWGVDPDAGKALASYLKAADLGEVDADYRAGIFYSLGVGVPKDPNEAERLWRIAAVGGVPDAEEAIGQLYFQGKSPGHSQADGVAWLERAGRSGRGDAYVFLAEWFSMMRQEDRAYDYAVLASRSRDRQAAEDGVAMMDTIMSIKRRAGLEPPLDTAEPGATLPAMGSPRAIAAQ